jgi:hypothetical protein
LLPALLEIYKPVLGSSLHGHDENSPGSSIVGRVVVFTDVGTLAFNKPPMERRHASALAQQNVLSGLSNLRSTYEVNSLYRAADISLSIAIVLMKLFSFYAATIPLACYSDTRITIRQWSLGPHSSSLLRAVAVTLEAMDLEANTKSSCLQASEGLSRVV